MAAEVHVGPRERLHDGTRMLVEIADSEVGVFEHGGSLYAYENRCVHQGGPACEGLIVGQIQRILHEDGTDHGSIESDTDIHLVCPWHSWEFELTTGRSVVYPSIGLKRYEVVERDGEVYVVV